MKSRVAAGVLGILLGNFGVHKFYLGKIWMGLLYLVFSWTGIPGIIGLIEGILYLVKTEEEFHAKYG
ncbi:TM2 domain-containing protein [Bacillus sp. AK128]